MELEPSRVKAATALYIGRIGDVIVATPFLRALRARFPQARLRLIVSFRSVQVLPLIPFIDESAVLQSTRRPLSALELAWDLLSKPCDLLVDLNSAPSRTSAAMARAIRSPVKLSFKKGRFDSAFTHEIAAPREREPMTERFARLAAALGAPYSPEPELKISPEDDAAAADILAKLSRQAGRRLRVLIHPGNFKRPGSCWAAEHFVEATERLLRDGKVEPVYMGGPGEQGPVRDIVSRLSRPVPILPETTLGVLAGVMRRMSLFLCNCTGTTHLATAAGARTFTIHTGYTAAVWRSAGPRHGGVASADWESCRDVPFETVYAALERFIAGFAGS